MRRSFLIFGLLALAAAANAQTISTAPSRSLPGGIPAAIGPSGSCLISNGTTNFYGACGAGYGTAKSLLYEQSVNTSAIASNTTIAPSVGISHVSGTNAITTITPPSGMTSTLGGCLTLIADGAWTTTTSGNIAATMAATANTPYRACYDGSKWFIK